MRINRNMSAVTANTQLLRVEKNLAASVQRLSSGYKINRPGDNPAGMAISNKMRAQLDALSQAGDNVSDGVSVMQIADGALSEVTSCLQRIRELAVQASNGVYTREDKQTLQNEIEQLCHEVDRISDDTEFNTKTLLNGSSDIRTYATPQEATRIRISDTVVSGTYSVRVNASAEQAKMETAFPSATPTDGTLVVNGVSLEVKASWTKDELMSNMTDLLSEADCTIDWATGDVISKRYGESATISMSASADLAVALGFAGPVNPDNGYVSQVAKDVAGNTLTDAQGNPLTTAAGINADVSLVTTLEHEWSSTASVTTDGNRVKVNDFNGFSIDFLLDKKATAGILSLEVTNIGAMTIQSGANQYQTMDLTIPEISSKSLYLDEIDVTVVGGGMRALTTMDDAITRLNEVRSRIGAFQNRLEYANTSLAEAEENMTGAYSTLLDTDMATEMVEYTQQNVLQQAATSVLAQANELPDTVLSLLTR